MTSTNNPSKMIEAKGSNMIQTTCCINAPRFRASWPWKWALCAIILLTSSCSMRARAAEAETTIPSIVRPSSKLSSPPVGPLPDPLHACAAHDDDESTCSEGTESITTTTTTTSSASPSAAVPSGMVYCPGYDSINNNYIIYENMGGCYYDNTNIQGSFVVPHDIQPGQMAPILWRGSGKLVSTYAFQVGLPPALTESLLNYATQLGIVDMFRELTSTSPIPAQEVGSSHEFFTSSAYYVRNNNNNNNNNSFSNEELLWYAQRPPKHWESNMHWISPADEVTHESYLKALADGQFDLVLDAVGRALKVDSLVAYHLSFIAVSHSEHGYSHHDTTDTNGGIYNVIIPLLLEDEDNTPELILWDDAESEPKERGGYKYQVGVGVMLGDDAVHGTHECDYRNLTNAKHGGWVDDEEDEEETHQSDQDEQNTSNIVGGGYGERSMDGHRRRRIGMRLAATVYIGEIYNENVHQVAERTLTQIFPPKNEQWLLAQEGRHWEHPSLVGNGGEHSTSRRTMAKDAGRKAFRSVDELDDCEQRADKGLCETDIEGTRYKCTFSCKVYIEEGMPTRVELIGNHDFANDIDGDNKPDSSFGGHINVGVRNRTGGEDCRIFKDDTDVPGDFISPTLKPGEMFPIIWRGDILKVTAPYAFQIGIPPELTAELLNYSNRIGLTDAMRELVGDNPVAAVDSGSAHEFRKLGDGNEWYVQRPPTKWRSNMHWISPSNERTHEEYLQVLARGNFDLVLDAIGTYLGLEGLVAYHLTFIGVSHSEKGYMHRDTHHTGGSVYNVIIPLMLEDNASPELVMTDEDDEDRYGSLQYRLDTAVMMGDDAMHGTEACNYRKTNGMRLAATVYIADVNDSNAEKIASQTLTQIFPQADEDWFIAQAGRHWTAGNDGPRRSLVNG